MRFFINMILSVFLLMGNSEKTFAAEPVQAPIYKVFFQRTAGSSDPLDGKKPFIFYTLKNGESQINLYTEFSPLQTTYLQKPRGQEIEAVLELEEFLPDSPGKSLFTLRNLADGLTFTGIGPSVNSHWTPTEEQLRDRALVSSVDLQPSVIWNGNSVRFTTSSINGTNFVTQQRLFGYVHTFANIEQHDRLIVISDRIFVNLETAEVLYVYPGEEQEDFHLLVFARKIAYTWPSNP